jgi:hypothetical protein
MLYYNKTKKEAMRDCTHHFRWYLRFNNREVRKLKLLNIWLISYRKKKLFYKWKRRNRETNSKSTIMLYRMYCRNAKSKIKPLKNFKIICRNTRESSRKCRRVNMKRIFISSRYKKLSRNIRGCIRSIKLSSNKISE